MDTKQKKIEELFKKGILAHEEMLNEDIEAEILDKIETEQDLLVLNADYSSVLAEQTSLVDWYEVDKHRVNVEKNHTDDLYQKELQGLKDSSLSVNQQENQTISSLETALETVTEDLSFETEPLPSSFTQDAPQPQSSSAVTIVLSHVNNPHKYGIQDFTNFFLSRYRFLESLLRNRQELKSVSSIQRVLSKSAQEQTAIIGLVEDISETKNNNIMLTIEDVTGRIKVLVTNRNKELYKEAKDLVVDEVIGVAGTTGDKIVFADTIVWPDIPRNHELKKGPEEEYVVFLSDIHVGSTLFLEEEFQKFLSWIQGNTGNEQQRAVAQNTKYVFIAGDLVDGVGIYPTQEEELSITDINGQYQRFTELISQIPKDKQIIICPGNHDAVHLAEPQPLFYDEFIPGLFTAPNITTVTNPALVNIGAKEGFEGFNVLMYHGYSFDYYVANVESIRTNGGYHRSDLIMKFLLKRRHLAPSFKSTPYHPSHQEDPLLIKTIPDFLITGHIHYSSVANYRGVTTISGSCWQGKTSFQEKLGHEPEPARVPVVNLKTREVKVLRFG